MPDKEGKKCGGRFDTQNLYIGCPLELGNQ